jgi:DNA-binding LacI/PurR family transcriptional regulator
MSQDRSTGARRGGPPGAVEIFAVLERAGSEARSGSGVERDVRLPARARDPARTPVGVVSLARESTSGPFWQPLVAAVCWRLLRSGCEPLRYALDPGPEGAAVPACHASEARGLVVVGATGRDEPALERLLASGLPAVLVDHDLIGERIAHVMSNNLEGMASVVRHLLRLGRRRIATLAGPSWALPGTDRLLGYRSAISALDLEEREEYVVEAGSFSHRDGLVGAEALLALPEPPDAIAAASDTLAVGAIVAAEQAGLRVPDDLAVTGFDDVGFARRMRPALTTVRQDVAGLAAAAVGALLTMMGDAAAAPSTQLLPTELVVRESSGSHVWMPARRARPG